MFLIRNMISLQNPGRYTTSFRAAMARKIPRPICTGCAKSGPCGTCAVIGVATRGSGGKGLSGCENEIAVYIETAPFEQLALQAFQLAGATPWLEGDPNPYATDASVSAEAGTAMTPQPPVSGCSLSGAQPESPMIGILLLASLAYALRRHSAIDVRSLLGEAVGPGADDAAEDDILPELLRRARRLGEPFPLGVLADAQSPASERHLLAA